MKKIIIAIMLVFCAATVRAENMNISTSQYYVDTNAATRQDAVPANNANSVMTYDSVSPNGIGAKAIYDTTATYETQTNALVTAATANAAIQNGINSEFVCANPPKCNLWDLAGLYGRLPSGYTELEYIESTGTQYIDTGIKIKAAQKVKIKMAAPASISGAKWMGAITTENNIIRFGWTLDRLYCERPNTSYAEIAYIDIDGNFHTYIAAPTSVSIDDVTVSTSVTENSAINFYLFAQNDARVNDISSWANAKISEFEITEGNTLIQKLIPARQNSTGALGMYDTVTNTFFTNQGTGTFIAGPAISYIPQNQ